MALAALSRRMLEAIADVYPEIEDECERQAWELFPNGPPVKHRDLSVRLPNGLALAARIHRRVIRQRAPLALGTLVGKMSAFDDGGMLVGSDCN